MRRLLQVSALILASAAMPGPCPAQTPGASTAEPAEQFPKPQPGSLTVAEIPGRLEKTAALLRAVTAGAAPERQLDDIVRRFPEFAGGVRTMIGSTRGSLQSGLTLAQLRDTLETWNLAAGKLAGWQSTLKNRSAALSSGLESLRHEDDVWTATAASAAALNLPANSTERITQINKSLDSAEQLVLSRRDEILEQQSKIADLQIEVDALTEQLRSALGQQRQSLIAFDSPPLWRGASGPAPSAGKGKDWELLFESYPGILRFYASDFLGSVLILFLACLVIVSGLVFLRRRVARSGERADPSTHTLTAVTRRPIAAALLLTITSGAIVSDLVSGAMVAVAWYLLLIPLLRLLPRLLPGQRAYPFWILALFFVAERSILLLPRHSLPARLAVLCLAACAMASLWWVYRQAALAGWTAGWFGLIRTGIWTATFLLSVSLAADLTGMFALSHFLLTSVVHCVYAAALLHGAGIILRAFTGLALQSRGARYVIPTGETSRTIQARLTQVITVLMFLLSTVIILRAFSLWAPIQAWIAGVFNASFSVGAFSFTLGNIAILLLIVGFSYLFSQVLRFFLQITVYPRLNLQLGRARAASKILHYSIMFAGFLCAVAAAGVEISKLVVLFSAFGVGIGFGLQNVVNNFVSGLILLFERPLQVGDRITVGDTSGVVSDIGIRASRIRTGQGADVLIPNGQLVAQQFINWTLSDPKRRADVQVGVAYGTSPDRVIELVRQVALSDARVLRQPEPEVLFTEFGDNAQNFVLHVWCGVEDQVRLTSSLRVALTAALEQAGIEMPFPQRDLNIRSVAPELIDAVREKTKGAEA
jgi:potassium-dependent mechanosensitive channel